MKTKTSYEIYMDYNRAIAQADRLRSIASRVRRIAENDMNSTLGAVRNNWSGENAEAYISKGHVVRSKISESADDLDKVADAIVKIAETVRDGELAAISIAST